MIIYGEELFLTQCIAVVVVLFELCLNVHNFPFLKKNPPELATTTNTVVFLEFVF